MKKISLSFLLAIALGFLQGQDIFTQSIRGTVVDAVTGYALAGASVILLDADPAVGTSADMNGNFILERVPLGRQSIEVSCVGYATRVVPYLFVSAGTETQVQVKMEENPTAMEEVVVRSVKRQGEGPE